MEFDADLVACADLVRQADPDRFQATMAAPVGARAPLFALYAFNVEVTRAPWASSETMIAEMRVQWWRDVITEIAQSKPVRRHFVATPLGRLLAPDLAALLDATCEARRWDVYKDPFEDEARFDAYVDATSGTLMWVAARALGTAEETVVRDFAYGVGVANWLRAIPDLEARGRIPLLDGTPDGVRALARKGLARLHKARVNRGRVSSRAGTALLSGWQAEAVLKQAVKTPARVADGALGQSEARRRMSLMVRAATGRW
jgi:15-cis-phytoene synthase